MRQEFAFRIPLQRQADNLGIQPTPSQGADKASNLIFRATLNKRDLRFADDDSLFDMAECAVRALVPCSSLHNIPHAPAPVRLPVEVSAPDTPHVIRHSAEDGSVHVHAAGDARARER